MRRPSAQSLLHFLRAFFLLGTAWAGFTVWAWTAHPEWVRAFGEDAVAAHVEPWELRLAAAEDAEDLATLAHALAEYRAGDRLGAVRRRALDELVERLAEDGRLDEAARRSSELVDLDPRDVAVRVRHGELLAAIPDRGTEGLAALLELCASLPADPRVVVPAARSLFSRGRADEALQLLLRRSEAVQPGEWLVDWGSDFLSRGYSTPIRHGERIEVRFELPPGVAEFRLRPPAYCSLLLHDPVIAVTAGGRRVELPLFDLSPRLSGCSRRGSNLRLHGEAAAAIALDVPKPFRALPLRCALVARATPGLPEAVVALLVDPATALALEESHVRPDSPAARLLEAARRQAAMSRRREGR